MDINNQKTQDSTQNVEIVQFECPPFYEKMLYNRTQIRTYVLFVVVICRVFFQIGSDNMRDVIEVPELPSDFIFITETYTVVGTGEQYKEKGDEQ